MRITAFRDAPTGADRYISGGIYGLSERAIDVLEKCLADGVSRMRNYQRALVAAGLDIRGYDLGKIIDVDHAADIDTAKRFIGA